MRVEPEHAELAARVVRVLRGGGDRADGERVVAAEEYRQAACVELRTAGVVHGAVPGGDLVQVAVAVDGRQVRVARSLQVAAVRDLDALRLEHGLQPRDAQRFRTHRGATHAGADVRGGTDDRDLLHHDERIVPFGTAAVTASFAAGLNVRISACIGWGITLVVERGASRSSRMQLAVLALLWSVAKNRASFRALRQSQGATQSWSFHKPRRSDRAAFSQTQ